MADHWRISTTYYNQKLPGSMLTMARAIHIVSSWLECPVVQALVPGNQHWAILKSLLLEAQVTGPFATDAQIAAITIEYDGTLCTADRGFARFPGLRWRNPLG